MCFGFNIIDLGNLLKYYESFFVRDSARVSVCLSVGLSVFPPSVYLCAYLHVHPPHFSPICSSVYAICFCFTEFHLQ